MHFSIDRHTSLEDHTSFEHYTSLDHLSTAGLSPESPLDVWYPGHETFNNAYAFDLSPYYQIPYQLENPNPNAITDYGSGTSSTPNTIPEQTPTLFPPFDSPPLFAGDPDLFSADPDFFSEQLQYNSQTQTQIQSPAPADYRDSAFQPQLQLQCWDHGCSGRPFSSKSNLERHRKERARASLKAVCPLCSAIFTRASARDTHLAKRSCNRIRRYSNGRCRPSKLALLGHPGLFVGDVRGAR